MTSKTATFDPDTILQIQTSSGEETGNLDSGKAQVVFIRVKFSEGAELSKEGDYFAEHHVSQYGKIDDYDPCNPSCDPIFYDCDLCKKQDH